MSEPALALATLLMVSMIGVGLAVFLKGSGDDFPESARRYRRGRRLF